MEAWITAGVPSITVAPFEPTAWGSLAERAVDKGLIWISYNQTTKSGYGTFGFGPCKQAELVGEKVIEYSTQTIRTPRFSLVRTSRTHRSHASGTV